MPRKRRDSASQFMQRLEFNPLQVLVRQANKMAREEPHSTELRDLCLDLMPYAYPKLKAVDHDVDLNGTVTVVIGGPPQSPNEVKPGD